jgi:hypothetical protein
MNTSISAQLKEKEKTERAGGVKEAREDTSVDWIRRRGERRNAARLRQLNVVGMRRGVGEQRGFFFLVREGLLGLLWRERKARKGNRSR